MPILRKEWEIFPDDIFAMSTDASPWQIVHVRSRQEKAVARVLAERGQPFYLPQIEKAVRRSGRSFRSFLPLFTGYVFIRRNADTHPILWSAGGVVRLLEVHDQRLLHEQLLQIRTLQEAGAVLAPGPAFAAGDEVKVTEGAFKGYTGIVLRERDALRLVVSIAALNKYVVAELPRDTVAHFDARSVGGAAARARRPGRRLL